MSIHNNGSNGAPPIILTISGFDPSCGAGTGADLKTFAAHGCYGIAAITCFTVQNTEDREVLQITPSAILWAQLDTLAKDCEIAAVKVGMLGNRDNAMVVVEFLDVHKFQHIVLDPAMKSSSGKELLDARGIKYLTTELLRRSSVITPTVSEAEILTGLPIANLLDMEAAARMIVSQGSRGVVIKGGYLERATDVLFDGIEIMQLSGEKIKTENTQGIGCTFASAIAAELTSGRPLTEAAMLAKAYVTKAIERSYRVGKGRVPLDHFYRQHLDPHSRSIHESPQHGMYCPAELPTH
jgi:hydroxymethylpyrimidine/phosphomethylpyrimidine kinase